MCDTLRTTYLYFFCLCVVVYVTYVYTGKVYHSVRTECIYFYFLCKCNALPRVYVIPEVVFRRYGKIITVDS